MKRLLSSATLGLLSAAAAVLATGTILLTRPAQAQFVRQCPLSQGYWKNHVNDWPRRSLALGNPVDSAHTYSQSALLNLLGTPARGDASLILAYQLIAAKLNVASGTNPAPIAATLTQADTLLSAYPGKLPYQVRTNTPAGQAMVAAASVLDNYNTGRVPNSCGVRNVPPIANAGPDQTLYVGDMAQLDGSGSSDANGDLLSFQWSLVSRPEGSQAAISDPTAVRPSFVVDKRGSYEARLIVNDSRVDSNPDTVIIGTQNSRPVADGGPDQTVPLGSRVYLDGRGSRDVDGDFITYRWRLLARPAASRATLDGDFTSEPNFIADQPGSYTIELVVNDGTADSNPDQVMITTENSRPVANAGPDQQAFVGDIVTLDGNASQDADEDPLTYRWSFTAMPNGSGVFLSDPNVVNPTFVPDLPGLYVLQLIVSDGKADSDADTASVTVVVRNNNPVAVNDPNILTAQNTAITISVLFNDFDPDGDPISIRGVTQGTSGIVTNTALTTTYTPNPGFSGIDNFTYIIADNRGGISTPATVTVTVDRPPQVDAGPDQSITLPAQAFLAGTVSDDGLPAPPNLTQRWSQVSGPGTVTFGDATAVDTTASFSETGTYVLRLTAYDGFLFSTDDVQISVNPPAPANNAPVATDDFYAVEQNTGLSISAPGVLANDNDPDTPTANLTAELVVEPAHSVAFFINGDGSFFYLPSFDFTGTDTFTYQVFDGQLYSNIAMVTIAVHRSNNAPVATDDFYAVEQNTGLSISAPGVLANDNDPDTPTANLTAELVVRPAHGGVFFSRDGSFFYFPPLDFTGTDTFTYQVFDGQFRSNTAMVTIAVHGLSNAPVATSDYYNLEQDTTLSVFAPGVLANDNDPDTPASILSANLVTAPSHAASFTFNADGSFEYTPAAGFHGMDTFTYQVNDETGASNVAMVTIAVRALSNAPVAGNDIYNTTENTELTIAAPGVLANDNDPDTQAAELTAELVSLPSRGIVSLSGDGFFTYFPFEGFTGTDTFTYRVFDGQLYSNIAMVQITVRGGADVQISFVNPPTTPAVGSNVSLQVEVKNSGSNTTGVTAHFQVPAGYAITGGGPEVGSYDAATGGWAIGSMNNGEVARLILSARVSATGPYDLTATITGSDQPDPDLTNNIAIAIVAPNPNANLRIAFINAPNGTLAVGTTHTWTVEVRNDGPATTTAVTVEHIVPAGYAVTGTNVHFVGPYDLNTGIWSIGSMGARDIGRLFITARVNAAGPTGLLATITNSSQPDPDLTDNVAMALSINRRPVANAGADQDVATGSFVQLDGRASGDPDGDPIAFQWAFTLRPASSAAVLLGAGTAMPAFTADRTGTYTIQLTVTDSVGIATAAVVTVRATGLSRPPLILSAPVTTGAVGEAYRYEVRAFDPDEGDLLTFSLPTAPAGMTINPGTGVIQWTPRENQGGSQSAAVRVQDQRGLFAEQGFAVQVSSAANRAPLAADDSYAVRVGESLSVGAPGVLANDSDPDNKGLTARLLRRPVNGEVQLGPDGSFIYTPYSFRDGEFVRAENINLATNVPGTTVRASSSASTGAGVCPVGATTGNHPQCAADGSLGTSWVTGSTDTATLGLNSLTGQGPFLEFAFPQDVDVAELQVFGQRHPFLAQKIHAGIFQLFDQEGAEIFNSGAVELAAPDRDVKVAIPELFQRATNIARTMPGVIYRASSLLQFGSDPARVFDGDLLTDWRTQFPVRPPEFVEVEFPADVTVHRVRTFGLRGSSRNDFLSIVVQAFDGAGNMLFDSGTIGVPTTNPDSTVELGGISGVRRVRVTGTAAESTGSNSGLAEVEVISVETVASRLNDKVRRARFTSTADDGGSNGLAEFKVIGSALLRRDNVLPDQNLAQRLPVSVNASASNAHNIPENAVDDNTSTNWYAGFDPGTFFELYFPIDVSVTGLQVVSPSGRPDGFASSDPMACSGTFQLFNATGVVLFDSGLVNEPSSPILTVPSVRPLLPVPNVGGVRRVRYTLSACTAGFGVGFSEFRVFGSAPLTTPPFNVVRKFQALVGREVHSTPIVANLTDDNRDGKIDQNDIPDIIVPVESIGNQLTGEIKVISGDDGRELFTAGGPNLVSPWSEVAVGDIDGDGLPDIVAVHADGNHLIAFDHTGQVKWISDPNPMPRFLIGQSALIGGAISIANLDGGPRPHIIVGASVFDSNGRLLGDGRNLKGTTGGTGLRSAISAVADLDLDGTPEIIAGPTAYRLVGGNLIKVWQRTDLPDGYVAVGNFDNDPFPEIVIAAEGRIYMLNHDGTDAEVWNPPSHAPVITPGDNQGGAGPAAGQSGAPLIVDVDGDGIPEIGIAKAANYILYNRDGTVRWKSAISDHSSHSTGSTAFDFDGDGQVEIVYRDEFFLRIFRGSDGVLLAKIPVGSATWAELCVVVDVDNDGHADIVCTSDNLGGGSTLANTGVYVLQDVANTWRRTRRIWNQHSYHITNVNEDGTIPQIETPNWLIPGLNNYRTNAFIPGESTDAADSFTYKATDGQLDSNEATVRIAIRTPNSAPSITSTPPTSAAVGLRFIYGVQASDPDVGDVFMFSLPTAPAGMTIDPNFGLIQWIPMSDQLGSHNVVVKVRDVRGAFALQGYIVQVSNPEAVPNVVGQIQVTAEANIKAANFAVGAISNKHSPTVPAGTVLSQNPVGGTLAVPGSLVSLIVSVGPPPPGAVPDVVGQTQSSAQADIAAAGFVVGAITGQNSTTVPLGIVISQNPAAGTVAAIGSAVNIVASLGRPLGDIDQDGDGFTPNQGDCNDADPNIRPGAFDIAGDGIDQNCNGVDSIAGDDTPPAVSIDSPADLAVVTMPTDIIGSANDANFLRYKLELSRVDENGVTIIGSGTTPVINGILGRLDPTLLENGLYRVRVTAEDVNGQATVEEKVYAVAGEAKVGIFALSFIDLQIPVSGIPITVIRSYDSRVKTQRDFGIGWSLQVKTGTYQNNRRPGEGWIINDQPFLGSFLPCIGGITETRSHLTEIRLSDRESYRFALTVSNGNLGITGACEGTASFRFLDGTTPGATLEILDGTAVIYLRGGADQVLDMNSFLDGTERVYNPQKVRLTTADGRKIDFDRLTGITRIEDNNGNALSITAAGIIHNSGKSIAFQRDMQGRIARITDPMGHTLNYGYDGNGDLGEFIDQMSNRTTFGYDMRHNLLEIRDPVGNRALRSEYDTDGRLIATIDAKGRRTEFTHDLLRREEVSTDALGNITRLVYDEQGNILSHEKPVTIDGSTVLARSQFAYDSKGNQTLIIDPDGIRWENAYDAFGNPLSMTVNPGGLNIARTATYTATGDVLTEADPNEDTTQFAYDTKANPNRWIDVDGRVSVLSYNTAGQVTRFQDPEGRITQVLYDISGHVQTRTDSLGNVTAYTYDANGNRLTATVVRTVRGALRGLTTTYTYDGKNRLIAVTDPLGAVTRTEYNAIGLKSAEVDALGRRTSFTYDETGALVRTEYQDGTFETREYDAIGNLVATTDREGLQTLFQYDEARRLSTTILPEGRTTRTIYTPGGRIAAQITADGSRTDYEYDAAGRMIRMRQPLVADAISGTQVRPEWRFEYDAGGRRTAVVDPKGNRGQFVFDSVARTVTVRLPDGTQVVESKDQWGRTLRRTDQEGNQTTFAYLADTSRLAAVTLPAPAAGQAAPIWHFAYDEVGNRLSQTDPLGRITRFEYDEINRLTRVVLPAGQTRSFNYDAIGRVIGLTDFDGATSRFEYDAADRLVSRILSDGSITRFAYTPGGRRSSVVDQRGLTSYNYDAGGRLIRITPPGVGDIEYVYDLLDRVTRITTPGGSTTYTYDTLSRLVDVSAASGSTSYVYDLGGNLTLQNTANTITGAFAYDQNNRLISLSYQKDAQILASFGYTYTPSGRRAIIAETGATTSFNYDRIGRLIQEVRTGATPFTRQFEYDLAGNRTRLLADGVQTLYSYDVNDRLLTAGSNSFTYDDRGNLTGRNDAGVLTTYAWTPDNRLARVTKGADTFTYRYDADGMRVEKQSSQGIVRYLVDTLNPTRLAQVLEERDVLGNLLRRYDYGSGLISSSEGVTHQFYHPDGQGHIRMLTDSSGQLGSSYDYDAFGNLVAETNATRNDYLYVGQQFDRDANLYYLRARYYDPGTGRFLGHDPVNGNPLKPVSLHRYIYAGNDPSNFADPTGEDFTLLGLSFANIASGSVRGIEVGSKLKRLCDVKGLAKVVPLAIGARGWLAKRSQFLEKLIGVLTPSLGTSGGLAGAVAGGSLAPLIPSFGLAFKEEIFKHPLADLVPPPKRLLGDPKKLEIEVSASSLTEASVKLTGELFPSTQVFVGPIVLQHTPNWALKSGSVGAGFEHPLFDIRVCGFISVGTVSVVAAASATATGFSSSAISGSVELGLKVAVPFLPEGSFTVIKVPDDFR